MTLNRSVSILFFSGIIITAVVLLSPGLPLGVTGTDDAGMQQAEWVWQRHSLFSGVADALERLLPAVLGGGLFLAVSFLGLRSLSTAGTFKSAGLYVLLLMATWIWMSAVQHTAPMSHRETKPYWVLYDPSASGYFFEAAYRIPSTEEFLSTYESRMAQGDVLHVGTHPPGLFLLAKGCLNACESSPMLVSCLQAIQNQRVVDGFQYLEQQARLTNRLTPAERQQRASRTGAAYGLSLSDTEVAALQLMSELSTLAIVLTLLPIALLCHTLFDSTTSWKVCCLWATVPCLAVFAPKSDVLFPLTCTTVLALSVAAMTKRSAATLVLAVLAGIVLWGGLLVSLAHLPVVVVLVAFAAIRAWQTKAESHSSTLPRDITVLLTVAATVIAVSLGWNFATGCRLQYVWPMNLSNHAGFYDQFPRTWWKWLLFNPLELMFAVGLPLGLAAIAGFGRSGSQLLKPDRQSSKTSTPHNSASHAATAFCLATAATWAALWLSGKNQGEAARLWCFLTPWLLIMVGQFLHRTTAPDQSRCPWRSLLIAQLLISTLTVCCVSGFSF